jgi:hypothetical protein
MTDTWRPWAKWFLVAAALSVVALNLSLYGRVRPTDLQNHLREIEVSADERPFVLVVGSSLTQHGVDKGLLRQELARRGIDLRVLGLAAGGMTPVERHAHLRALKDRHVAAPSLALFELSTAYDFYPVFGLWSSRYTVRIIDIMDWPSAIEVARWLRDDRGSRVWTSDLVRLFVRHYMSLGRVADAVPIDSIEPWELFGPLAGHSSYYTESVHQKWWVSPPRADFDAFLHALPWSRWQAGRMAETVKEHGAAKVGFYAMPIPGGTERAYWAKACDGREFCIVPDEALMSRLEPYGMWFDGQHLSDTGRELYTAWLAERLADHLLARKPGVTATTH